MDKSEPTFIPEWLKSNGSTGNGGNNKSSSFLFSEDHSGSRHSRHKPYNSRGRDIGRSFVSDRATSSYFHRSSSAKDSSRSRPLGSSTRYSRDREWDYRHDFGDKDKPFLGEHRYPGSAYQPAGVHSGKSNKDMFRHSKSMTSRKSDDTSLWKGSGDLSDGSNGNHINSSTLLPFQGSKTNSIQADLAKDFPSLRTEQEKVSLELSRSPSPALATSAPGASSSITGTEGWTSSLAEVPGPIRSNSTGSLSSQGTVSPRSAPLAQHANGLNMAEAVSQNPTRARTPPQLTVDTQRLEELAIKQSRQLIPVTPSISKPVLLCPLDKSKSKTVQQSPFLTTRFDAAKTANLSKLQVLKPSREMNGFPPTLKEKSAPRNGFSSPLSQTPSGASAASARKNNPFNGQVVATPDRRTVAPSAGTMEKRLSPQIQSRKDFLNHIKKQSSGIAPTARTDGPPSVLEKSNDSVGEAAAPEAAASVESGSKQDLLVASVAAENGCKMTENGECVENGGKTAGNGECHEAASKPALIVPPPSEEEAKFMRSCGWKEPPAGEEEGGLTEEEIRSFYEHVKATKPSELPRLQHRAINGVSSPNSSEH